MQLNYDFPQSSLLRFAPYKLEANISKLFLPLTRPTGDLFHKGRGPQCPTGVIPAKAGTQERSHIKFSGSRTLKKSKRSLRFSKFRDDANWVMGEVTRRAGEGAFFCSADTFIPKEWRNVLNPLRKSA